MSISMITANYSLRLAPLSVYAIILSLKPILVIILGYFYGIEKCTVKKLVFIFLSFLGAGLIINPSFFERIYASLTGKIDISASGQAVVNKGRLLFQ